MGNNTQNNQQGQSDNKKVQPSQTDNKKGQNRDDMQRDLNRDKQSGNY